jgi:hypothetical protein
MLRCLLGCCAAVCWQDGWHGRGLEALRAGTSIWLNFAGI